MARLERGQINFKNNPPPMRTCHDIRKWCACPQGGHLGHKDHMLDGYHGRCFARKFGLESMFAHKRAEISRLTLGDLGVRLMGEVLDHLAREKQ